MPNVTPQILRNLGIPVRLSEVHQEVSLDTKMIIPEGGSEPVEVKNYRLRWRKKIDEKDRAVTNTIHFSLDNNALATIEAYYGSMEAFNNTLQARGSEALRVAYCAGLGYDPSQDDDLRRVGVMLLDEDTALYVGALQVAIAVANGVDPTQAVALWEETRTAVKESREQMAEVMEKTLDDATEERRQMSALTPTQQETLREISTKFSEIPADVPKEQLPASQRALLDLQALRPSEKASLTEPASGPAVKATTSTRGKTGSATGSASDEPTKSSGD